MLTLYYAPRTCALATHLALELSGLPYEARPLDFRAQQQRSAEYLAINPKGRVPALVTEHGVLTETPALLLYVAQSAPAARLAPLADPFALARMNEFNAYLCATVHVNHAHGARGSRWTDDAAAIESMKRKVPQTMAGAFELIERDFLRGPWVLGEAFSTSDLYLYTISQWLEGDGVDIARFPRVAAHAQAVRALPAVQRVEEAQRARPPQ